MRPVRPRNLLDLRNDVALVAAAPVVATAPRFGAGRPVRTRAPLVGAPPASVSAGLPGAHGEVRAYAERIGQRWEEFVNKDVNPWTIAKNKQAKLFGELKVGTEEERAMLASIVADLSRFKGDAAAVADASFWSGGASEWWQKFQGHENALRADRQLFAKVTAPRAMVSPEFPDLEPAGGVDPEKAGTGGGLLGGLGVNINTGLAGLAGLAILGLGVAFVLRR